MEGSELFLIDGPWPAEKKRTTPMAITIATRAATKRHQIVIGLACEVWVLATLRETALPLNWLDRPQNEFDGLVGDQWMIVLLPRSAKR